ncbi:MAG TPA: sialidase family protein [Candidatus Eisenbacteria bacterium]|nr:sialidase family protein [Candidatus Eisenbacteria bacterium]
MRTISRSLAITVGALLSLLAAGGPAEAAVVNFDVQANLVQPSPFPQNKQNEPAIAQNPAHPTNLIAGANDEIDLPACTATGCPFVGNVGLSGIYVSNNSGASWSQFSAAAGGDNTASFNGGKIHTLPGFRKLARDLGITNLASDGDPTIAFSRAGVAYYGSLAGVRGIVTNSELLTVSRSTDGGATWSGPVLATDKTNPVDFNDKINLWVDAGAGSPFAGNVYVSWTLFQGGPGRAEPIVFSRSTDGGQTFSPARQLTPAHNNNSIGGRQGSAIRTAANGDVYVFFESGTEINGTKTSAQMFVKSTDGGQSFSKQQVASTVVDIPSPLPGSSFRNDSFPSVDIDQTSGKVYVAWADFRNGRGQVMLTTSSDGGGSWTAAATVLDVAGRSAFFPGVAVSPDGSKVTVATQALDAKPAGTAPGAGVVHYDSYLVESVGGGTFSAPLKLSSASSDPDGSSTNGLTAQFQGDYNTLISDNTHAWFIWTDARGATPCTAVDAFRAGTGPRPSVPASCAGTFGNTDIFVGRVSL